MKYTEIQSNISGIYKINFPNGKIYIGRAKNIKGRIWEHYAKNDNTPCHFALRKYYNHYSEIDVDILEQVQEYSHDLICELEIYYIKKFNSTDRNIGYNITSGGDGAGVGVNNVSSKISQEDLDQIIILLNQKKTNVYIGNLFGLHPDTIGRINQGKNYYNPKLKYPIRSDKGEIPYYEKYNSFSNEQLDNALFLLGNSTLSRKEIREMTQISEGVLTTLNLGKHSYCKNVQLDYPIRKSRRTIKLTEEDIQNIKIELRNPSYSIQDIAEHFGCSRDTIGDINQGKRYNREDEQYPIRTFYPQRGSKKPVSTILGAEEQEHY